MLQIAGMYGCLSVPEGISHIELGPRCHKGLFLFLETEINKHDDSCLG